MIAFCHAWDLSSIVQGNSTFIINSPGKFHTSLSSICRRWIISPIAKWCLITTSNSPANVCSINMKIMKQQHDANDAGWNSTRSAGRHWQPMLNGWWLKAIERSRIKCGSRWRDVVTGALVTVQCWPAEEISHQNVGHIRELHLKRATSRRTSLKNRLLSMPWFVYICLARIALVLYCVCSWD